MDFNQQLAAFVLKILRHEEIPNIAVQALVEGFDSNSLRILASYTSVDYNFFEIQDLLKKIMLELNIQLPTKTEASKILISFYIDEIIEKKIDPFVGVENIIKDIYYKSDMINEKYVGDCLGIEKLYGLYDDYNEFTSRHFNDSNKSKYYQVIDKIKESIIKESINYKNNFIQKSA